MKQITIFAPVQDGLVARVSEVLGRAGINIESLDAMDVKDIDVISLTVDLYDRALEVLRDAGFNAISEDAVLVKIKDEPGALAKVTKRLYEAGIHVRSIRIIHRGDHAGLVAVSMDRTTEGLAAIRDLLLNPGTEGR